MAFASAGESLMVPGRRRYESLDQWRGLACLLVIVYHSTILHVTSVQEHPSAVTGTTAAAEWLLAQTNTFSVGVALFFVISGYCISAAADRVRQQGHGVRGYFFRRFRRIYPPFWIVLALSVAFFVLVDFWPLPGLLSSKPWAQPRPNWYSASQWFGNITLTETWRHHLFGATRAHFPGQSWTLCYEEQFYLLTGLLLAFVPRAFFAGACGITLVTLLAVSYQPLLRFPIDGFFVDGSWLLFAAGIAVYYRVNYASGWRSRAIDVVLLASIPIAWFLDIPVNGATIGFVFAAALPFLYTFDRQITAATIFRPLVGPGQMCYSLYLVHQLPVRAVTAGLRLLKLGGTWPTLFLAIPAGVGFSVALGWLFHTTIERRFLNQREPGPVQSRRPLTAIQAPAIARVN
jgi:peptidoglycan/LPS O-acetylase OafA/YrhL